MGIAFSSFWDHYDSGYDQYDDWFRKQLDKAKRELGFEIQQVSFNLAKYEKTSSFNDRIASLNALLPDIYKPERFQIAIASAGNLNLSYGGNDMLNPLRNNLQFFTNQRPDALKLNSLPPNTRDSSIGSEIPLPDQDKGVDKRLRANWSQERLETARRVAKAMRETRHKK